MGDDEFGFDFSIYENVLELVFQVRTTRGPSSALEARRTLEAAVRKMPDSALRGMKSFRIVVNSKAKK